MKPLSDYTPYSITWDGSLKWCVIHNETAVFSAGDNKTVASSVASSLNTAYQLGRGDLLTELAVVTSSIQVVQIPIDTSKRSF